MPSRVLFPDFVFGGKVVVVVVGVLMNFPSPFCFALENVFKRGVAVFSESPPKPPALTVR